MKAGISNKSLKQQKKRSQQEELDGPSIGKKRRKEPQFIDKEMSKQDDILAVSNPELSSALGALSENIIINPLPLRALYSKKCIKKDEMVYTPINRICFRGDDRNPLLIFLIGFTPRPSNDDDEENSGILFPFVSENHVAVSKRLGIATLFPWKNAVKKGEFETWVYLVSLEKGFDVHSHGVIYLQISKEEQLLQHIQDKDKYKNRLETIFQPSYAEEMITPYIPSSHIIGAVKVKRTQVKPKGKFPEGTYELGEVVYNANCKLPDNIINAVKDFITKEKSLGAQPIPQPASAYRSAIKKPIA